MADHQQISLLSQYFIRKDKTQVHKGDIRPDVTDTYDLGASNRRYDNVYAKSVTADTIGGTLGGQTWTYGGDMNIEPVDAGQDTTLYLQNTDGTYLAHLNVEGNIILGGTVDGVDLATFKSAYDTHVATNDAHHDPVTVTGAGLTLSTQDISINFSTGTPTTVNAGDTGNWGSSAYPSRSDHEHPVSTGTPGTISADDPSAAEGTSTSLARADHVHGLVSAAPVTLDVDSTSNVEGVSTSFARADHEHAVTTITDASAPTEGILASTAAGGLTLANLTVAGNVDITSGGDLTVGSNILFVDASQGNVGIGGAPNVQYALDVFGSLHVSDWIVGNHAMQLDGALAIFHWDGPRPFESNYHGFYQSHMGHPIDWGYANTLGSFFDIGKFHKGLSVANAYTNYVCDPVAVNSSGKWVSLNSATVTLNDVGPPTYGFIRGSGCGKVVTVDQSASINGARHNAFPLAGTSTTHNLSIALCVPSGETITVQIRAQDWSTLFTQNVVGTGEWERYNWTFTSDSTTANDHRIDLRRAASTDTITFWFDEIQITEGAVPHAFVYGDMGVVWADSWQAGSAANGGARWSGTANDSTTIKVRAQLYYGVYGSLTPLGDTDFTWGKGTLGFWVKFHCDMDGTYTAMTGYNDIFIFAFDASSHGFRFETRGANPGYMQVWCQDQDGNANNWTTASFDKDVWSQIIVTFDVDEIDATDSDKIRMYQDGVEVLSGTTFNGFWFDVSSSYFRIGHTANASVDTLPDATFDDMFFLNRAMTPDEVLALYESDAPVFAETATFGFNTGGGAAIWADAEGLWGRDTSGNAIIGLSAVDSKSWGGFTLDAGDFTLGKYNSGGWLKFDNSAGSLVMGYGTTSVLQATSSGSQLVGTLTVTGSGIITCGGGEITLDSDGITINALEASPNTIKFQETGTTFGEIWSYYSSSIRRLSLRSLSTSSSVDAYIGMSADNTYSGTSYGSFTAWAGNTVGYARLSATDASYLTYLWCSPQGVYIDGSGGLYVGATPPTTVPPDGMIFAAADIRTAGGLVVGNVTTNPATNMAIIAGGLRVGDTTAPTDNDIYAAGDIIANVDIYRTAWQSWSPTKVGWASETCYSYYKKVGKLVQIQIVCEGTSNSATTTITLPSGCQLNTNVVGGLHIPIRVKTGSSWATGLARITQGSATITFYNNVNGSTFGTTGDKYVYLNLTYEANA